MLLIQYKTVRVTLFGDWLIRTPIRIVKGLIMWFIKSRGIKWVGRAAQGANDFTVSDFTGDSTWHELDFSSKLPTNAKWVLFSVGIKGNVIASYMQWNSVEVGGDNPQYDCQVYNTSVTTTRTIMLPLSSDLKVLYRLQAAITWSSVNLDIIAYGK